MVRLVLLTNLQTVLRPKWNLRYRLFANAMLLSSAHDDARALMHLVDDSINIVIAAPRPGIFLDRLCSELTMTLSTKFSLPADLTMLCPRCIQGSGLYSALQAAVCVAGHKVTQTERDEGCLWEQTSWCRNRLWSPKVR